jgi:hypothetical protein
MVLTKPYTTVWISMTATDHSINSLEADLLRDAVARLWAGVDQNEHLRPAVANLVYVLNHHWLMWAHGWELTIGDEATTVQEAAQ